jgi:NTP pyrophosphatase (non-canonical NTP hydrolase)
MLGTTITQIEQEQRRQIDLWGIQNHRPEHWLAILMEEVGEVSREILESSSETANKHYRDELVQVAAVAVSMIESYDRVLYQSNSLNTKGNE